MADVPTTQPNGGEDHNADMDALDADDEPITVPRGWIVAVLDIATGSMDFGSGFLNDSDVEALRRLAEAVGVDPMGATPSTHICKYKGEHSWQYHERGWGANQDRWYCRFCHHSSAEKPADADSGGQGTPE